MGEWRWLLYCSENSPPVSIQWTARRPPEPHLGDCGDEINMYMCGGSNLSFLTCQLAAQPGLPMCLRTFHQVAIV